MISALPLILLCSYGWFLNDKVSLLSYTVLVIASTIALLFYQMDSWKFKRIDFIVFLWLGCIFVSVLANNQNFYGSVVGGYTRNFGIGTYIALTFLFYIFSNTNRLLEKFIILGLLGSLIVANIIGYIEIFGIIPAFASNRFNSLNLTLGNPNFASSTLALLAMVLIYFLIQEKYNKFRIYNVLLLFSTIFLILRTNSMQGLIIIIFGFVIFSWIYFKFEIRNRIYLSSTILILSLFGIFLLIWQIFSETKSQLYKELISATSATQRLEHWRISLEIWKENPWLGVGVDQFQNFAAFYRKPELVVLEGNFSIPDSAHNSILNFLASFGIIATLSWLVFICWVCCALFRINKSNFNNKAVVALLCSIWFCYLFQSLINPSFIWIECIGFITAGLIIGLERESYKSFVITLKSGLASKAVFAILVSYLIFSTFYSSQILANDFKVGKILNGEVSRQATWVDVAEEFPNLVVSEKIANYALKNPSNCDTVIKISNKILEINDRRSNTLYMKAVCYANSRDFNKSIYFINSALNYDPLNVFYLVSKARVELAAGMRINALNTFNLATSINPEDIHLLKLKSELSSSASTNISGN